MEDEVKLVEIGVLKEDGYLSLEMSEIDDLGIIGLTKERDEATGSNVKGENHLKSHMSLSKFHLLQFP